MNIPLSYRFPHSFSRRIFIGKCAAAAAAPVLGLSALAEESKEIDPADYVTFQAGDLPIIISAPHGGMMDVPGIPERIGEGMKTGGAGFYAGRDANTEILAAAIARELETLLGKKPYFVIAKFHRKYIDANRPPEIAVEHPVARKVYDRYRAELAGFCDKVHQRFERGLLIDVHGQGSSSTTCFRGTQNGATVAKLVKLIGEESHSGPQSLAGLLNAQGIKMVPTDRGAEEPGFTGGHIVQTYGKHEGIGAVQFEYGMGYRQKSAIQSSAEKTAAGVAEFANRYLLGRRDAKK